MVPETTYEHAEAFALMTYRADDDKTDEEVVWNSRDGVTPFVMTNKNGRTATHVNWQADQRDPGHKPKVGDRIWVDLTAERAEQIANERAELYWNSDDAMGRYTRSVYHSLDEVYAVLAQGLAGEVEKGAPDLVTVTEEMVKENGWVEDEQLEIPQEAAGAADRLLGLGLRDPYGYRLSQDACFKVALWVLAQDSGHQLETREEWVDAFLSEMLTSDELPNVGSDYDVPAEDDLVWQIVQAVLVA